MTLFKPRYCNVPDALLRESPADLNPMQLDTLFHIVNLAQHQFAAMSNERKVKDIPDLVAITVLVREAELASWIMMPKEVLAQADRHAIRSKSMAEAAQHRLIRNSRVTVLHTRLNRFRQDIGGRPAAVKVWYKDGRDLIITITRPWFRPMPFGKVPLPLPRNKEACIEHLREHALRTTR